MEDPDLTSSHRRSRATATSGAAGSEPYPDTGKVDFPHPECEERPHEMGRRGRDAGDPDLTHTPVVTSKWDATGTEQGGDQPHTRHPQIWRPELGRSPLKML